MGRKPSWGNERSGTETGVDDGGRIAAEDLKLPWRDREVLASELLGSVDTPADPYGSDEEWLVEINRRAEAFDLGEPGIPWEEVRGRILARLDKK